MKAARISVYELLEYTLRCIHTHAVLGQRGGRSLQSLEERLRVAKDLQKVADKHLQRKALSHTAAYPTLGK